ncbi:MAG: hypothetical protein GX567_14020 [Clostridia bacterium]|nr:hypothetical protein [Clostridia bacterium]
MRVINGSTSQTLIDFLGQKNQAIEASGNDLIDLIRSRHRESLSNDAAKTSASALSEKKSIYETLSKESATLSTLASKLQNEGEDSLFAKAEASGDKKELLATINSFIEQYNQIYTDLNTAGGEVNTLYAKILKEFATQNSEKLSAVGITQKNNGTLAIDAKTIEKADLAELKGVFKESGSFGAGVADTNEKVAANAKTYMDYFNGTSYGALSNAYGLSGSSFDAQS